MTPKNYLLPYLLAALTTAGTSWAETDEFYEIEFIAFTHYPNSVNQEQWPDHERSDVPANAITLFTNLQPTEISSVGSAPIIESAAIISADRSALRTRREFSRLSPQQLQLGGAVTTLQRKRIAERILIHSGWIQKIKPANATTPVIIQAGDQFLPVNPGSGPRRNQAPYLVKTELGQILSSPGTVRPWRTPELAMTEPPEEGPFELTGTLAFYQTRYPRLETNLCLLLKSDQGLQPPILPVSNQFPHQAGFAEVCSREIRGLKYGEMIYFDTPLLGLLAQVRRLDKGPESTH